MDRSQKQKPTVIPDYMHTVIANEYLKGINGDHAREIVNILKRDKLFDSGKEYREQRDYMHDRKTKTNIRKLEIEARYGELI